MDIDRESFRLAVFRYVTCIAEQGGKLNLIAAVAEGGPDKAMGWLEKNPNEEELIRALVSTYVGGLLAQGYRIIAPGHIPMPTNKDEARAMSLVADAWLGAEKDREAKR